jgi:menaquinone-dependent protoporphyrinogen IX oxidase
MKGIIVYKSKYGSTKQFSEWLKESTGFDITEVQNAPLDFSDYKIIVIGSSIHGGVLSQRKWIIDNWNRMQKINIALMLTSGTADTRFLSKVLKTSLPDEILSRIKVFPVGGRYVFKRMSIVDRILIRVVAFLTKDKNTKMGMLKERDEVNRNNLKDIIAFIGENSD